MVAGNLSFATLHPFYIENYWDKRPSPDLLSRLLRWLPKVKLLANQHDRIMDGTLLRGIRQKIEIATKPQPELTKRQVKILRRLKAGDWIFEKENGGLQLHHDGSRRCNIRLSDVQSLERRGLIGMVDNMARSLTPYGLNALARVA